jgi:hypothetical protein
MCCADGIVPQAYLTNGGSAFTSRKYELHLEQFKQTICFSSTSVHQHNGHAEHAICTAMAITRSMMLHDVAIHWPGVADLPLYVAHGHPS